MGRSSFNKALYDEKKERAEKGRTALYVGVLMEKQRN
jgi:hypothetical protein